jgi:hypothetical protein
MSNEYSEIQLDNLTATAAEAMNDGHSPDAVIALVESHLKSEADTFSKDAAINMLASLAAHAVFHIVNLKSHNEN